MKNESNSLSRKKFLFWSIGAGSFLAIPAFLRRSKKQPDSKTVKMLTQDGKLVEIQVDRIPVKKQKIKSGDIHTWINKKTQSL